MIASTGAGERKVRGVTLSRSATTSSSCASGSPGQKLFYARNIAPFLRNHLTSQEDSCNRAMLSAKLRPFTHVARESHR
jgi:hypothetical protein